MKNTILLLLYLCFNIGFAQEGYEIKNNIPYYPESVLRSDSYIGERCKLDLYYPKTKNFPTLVYFHGGGLTGGSKFLPERLTKQGFAVVAVNYRLSPKAKAANCIEDAAAATAWVFNNIASYGGNPDKVFVTGHSAGAYLTLMIGLDKKWLAKENIDANRIAGLIPMSGQCITHFLVRQEKGIGEKQPLIDELAPLYHVRPDAPPLVLITGDRELEFPARYEENAYLARMMKIAGHSQTKLYELGGYGHMMEEPGHPLLIEEVRRILKIKP